MTRRGFISRAPATVLTAFASRFQHAEHEFRIDWNATRLWLFHEGTFIREAARSCLDRLRVPAHGAAAFPSSAH